MLVLLMEEYLKDSMNIGWLWWQGVHTKFRENLLTSSNVTRGGQANTNIFMGSWL
jgi:hypothetical protein